MKAMRLENVKAFFDTTDIEIAPITIFVGRNSCGKSSFIRFPQVLKQTFSSGMDNPIYLIGTQEDSIDYGTYQEVLHNGEGDGFSVTLTYPIDYDYIVRSYRSFLDHTRHNENDSFQKEVKIRITYSIPEGPGGSKGKRVYATKIESFVDGEFFSSYTKIGATKEYIFKQEKTIQNGQLVDAKYTYKIKSTIIQNYMPSFAPTEVAEAIYRAYISADGPLSYEHLTDIMDYRVSARQFEERMKNESPELINARNAFSASTISVRVFTYIYEVMQREFLRLKYIGPFRSEPKRYYRDDGIEHSEVGIRGDYTSSLLLGDETLQHEVSIWFKDALKSTINVNPVGEGTGLYTITAIDAKQDETEDIQTDVNREKSKNKGSNLMDVGFGFSQILPIVVQLMKLRIDLNKKKKSPIPHSELVVIEQPELHLHPAAQAKLASLFVDTIDPNKPDRCRMIVETHSEHFIRSLQVMIADPECFLTKEMVRIYYVDKAKSGGSEIKEMTMTDEGQFYEEWPSGFFDEAFRLSRDLLNAINMRAEDGE